MEAVNQLLSTKGYDLMTVDEVAALAGIAKASLYKLFSSKEALAAAAMVQVLDQALVLTAKLEQDSTNTAMEKMRTVSKWAIREQLNGAMPTLPAQNSVLSNALQAHKPYMDRLITFSDLLGGWIMQAQKAKQLNTAYPPEMVLYTLFACACNPVLGMLKASGQYTDEKILDWVLDSLFSGLGPTMKAAPVKSPKLKIR